MQKKTKTKQTTIVLFDGFFIEVDELNHTLKRRKIIKDKETNEEKTVERTIGYYKNVQDCLERVVRLVCLDECNGMIISLRDYAEKAEKAFKKVEEWRKQNEL